MNSYQHTDLTLLWYLTGFPSYLAHTSQPTTPKLFTVFNISGQISSSPEALPAFKGLIAVLISASVRWISSPICFSNVSKCLSVTGFRRSPKYTLQRFTMPFWCFRSTPLVSSMEVATGVCLPRKQCMVCQNTFICRSVAYIQLFSEFLPWLFFRLFDNGGGSLMCYGVLQSKLLRWLVC